MKEPTFQMELPSDWVVRRDEERIYAVCPQPPGVLCCTPQEVEDSEEFPNLSRMLAGFLTRSGHPVATDELLRITGVAHAHGFCWQYVEDDTFHRIWIFGNARSWLLLTFTCPAPHQGDFSETLNELIRGLSLTPPDPEA